MTDARQKLLNQITALRERVDPVVLDRAERVAKAYRQAAGTKPKAQPSPANDTAPPDGLVPYDKDAAREAVRLFLENRNDGGQFRRQLAERLLRQQPQGNRR